MAVKILVREKRQYLMRLIVALVVFLLVFSLAVPLVSSSESAEPAFDPIGKKDGYSAVLYDNTNGLPTSEANDIASTSEGFIWIGSYSGLIRFDGNTFERFDSTTGIASVVSLFVDSKDRLWAGTNDSGAAVIERDTIRLYTKEDGLKSSTIRSIAEDDAGNIYIASTHGIAVVGDDMELRAFDAPQINEEYIKDIIKGCDGIIYGITKNGAVFTIYDSKLTGFYDSSKMGISDIHSIMPDPDKPGYIYLGTKNSEVYYGELSSGFRSAVKYDVSPLEYINSIGEFGDRIWICSDNGIGVVHDDTVTILENLPVDTAVEKMMIDYQGNLWFTSSKQGVMKIVPNQFADITSHYGLPEMVVNSTCVFGGKLLIGGKTSGLTVLGENGKEDRLPIKSAVTASGKKLDEDDLIEMLGSCNIRSIITDSRGRLWISSYGDNPLVIYDNGKVTRFSTEDGLPSERVRTVYECDDGSMLAACTGGVVVIENDEVKEVYGESSGISNLEVLTVTQASDGTVIAGTDGDGIYTIKGSKAVHYGIGSGLSSEVIMRIKKDISRDLFWIVTSNSIAYMTADNTITTIKKFPYSNNFDLYENKNGEMWILSSNGIYVAEVEELLRNEEINTVFYSRYNGLQSITTSNSYSALTENGDLYIAGNTGVSKVNIDIPFEDVKDLLTAVPYIEADGKKVYPDKNGEFRVSKNTRKITIYSFVYNYSLLNPLVTYYLDGFDREQTTVARSELAPINYTNLKGGTYQFVIQLNDPQGHGFKQTSVTIRKDKWLRERVWFKAAAAALIIGVCYLAVILIMKYRTKKFLRKQEEDKLLIREIVQAFAKVIDMKDKYTNGHSTRVAEYTAMLAKELGYSEEETEKFYNIALLHDIGKVGIPPEVLNKPGKLSDNEFNIIKSHSALGYNVLKDISIMPELADGAGSHHERPDGKGYPKGLKGDEIPRAAQIIAVADTFDAMYSDRPYRKRMNFEKAVSILQEGAGTQLSSDVVDAFLRLVEKGCFRAEDDNGGGTTEDIDNIHRKYADKNKS